MTITGVDSGHEWRKGLGRTGDFLLATTLFWNSAFVSHWQDDLGGCGWESAMEIFLFWNRCPDCLLKILDYLIWKYTVSFPKTAEYLFRRKACLIFWWFGDRGQLGAVSSPCPWTATHSWEWALFLRCSSVLCYFSTSELCCGWPLLIELSYLRRPWAEVELEDLLRSFPIWIFLWTLALNMSSFY